MTFLYPRMLRNISYLLVTTSTLALGSSAEAVRSLKDLQEDLHLDEAHSLGDVTARVRPFLEQQKEALERLRSQRSTSSDESVGTNAEASADVSSGARIDTTATVDHEIKQAENDLRLSRLVAITRYQILTGLTDVGPDQKPRVERRFHEERVKAHSTIHAELGKAVLSSLPVTSDSLIIGADLGRLTAHAQRLAAFYTERPYDLSQEHKDFFEASGGVYIGLSALRPYIYVRQDETDKAWGKVVFLSVLPIHSQEVTEAKTLLREISSTLGEADTSFIDRSGPIVLARDTAVWGSDLTLPTLSPLTERFIASLSVGELFAQYRHDYVPADQPAHDVDMVDDHLDARAATSSTAVTPVIAAALPSLQPASADEQQQQKEHASDAVVLPAPAEQQQQQQSDQPAAVVAPAPTEQQQQQQSELSIPPAAVESHVATDADLPSAPESGGNS